MNRGNFFLGEGNDGGHQSAELCVPSSKRYPGPQAVVAGSGPHAPRACGLGSGLSRRDKALRGTDPPCCGFYRSSNTQDVGSSSGSSTRPELQIWGQDLETGPKWLGSGCFSVISRSVPRLWNISLDGGNRLPILLVTSFPDGVLAGLERSQRGVA